MFDGRRLTRPLAGSDATSEPSSSFFFQLLSFPLDDCPRYQQLIKDTELSEEFVNITSKYKVPFLSPFEAVCVQRILEPIGLL